MNEWEESGARHSSNGHLPHHAPQVDVRRVAEGPVEQPSASRADVGRGAIDLHVGARLVLHPALQLARLNAPGGRRREPGAERAIDRWEMQQNTTRANEL